MARKNHFLLFGIVAAIALVLIGAVLSFSKKADKEKGEPLLFRAHLYKNPEMSLKKINLKLFYVVPKNKTGEIYEDWRSAANKALEEMVDFHKVQLKGLSKINYEVYGEPFILEKDNLFYDTLNTENGNPEALRQIVPELERRASDFLQKKPDEYLVIGLIYEGVGSSGAVGEGAFIISRTFFTDEQYSLFSSSLFYHEFGHTLGLPDQYDLTNNDPFSEDIMGSGRRRPLRLAYIDKSLLKEMGIIPD